MEVKEKSAKRELIKSIAIVFLVILLILTFFSNTIMNYSLAEVATQPISSGTINAKIRGSGTVEANESYEVIIPQTREVRAISVQVGDFVSEGDVLFVLGDVESQELTAAQEQLDALNLQYQQQLLTLSREQASEDQAMKILREELKDAQRQRDENAVTAEEISAAKSTLATAESDLLQISRTLEELNAALSGDETYTQAKAAVDQWTAEVESARALMEEYQKQLWDLNFGGTDYSEAVLALNQAKTKLESDWKAYKATVEELMPKAYPTYVGTVTEAILSINDIVINVSSYLTGEALKAENQRDPNYDNYVLVWNTLIADKSAVDAAQRTYDSLTLGDSQNRGQIEAKLIAAQNDYTYATGQLEQAQRALSFAEANQTSMKSQIKSFEASQREQTAYVETLKAELAALESRKALYDQACELVKQKQRAIEDALVGEDIDQQLDDLSLQTLRSQIEKAQELVDKYTAESVDTEVCAKVSGMISAIHVTAGKEAAAGSSMATIELVDRGYMLKIPVTNEQSRQVRVGDTATVSNYYWGANVEAVLESITADPQNPGKGKLLVFRVTGEVDAGSNLTLSIGQRSANYDAIIPKSALRQDTNGYFVLVITVKSSPLSNRYIATRVDVQVLAEDDTSAAVSGLSGGDFVITTSSRPVEAGHQVRMVENP